MNSSSHYTRHKLASFLVVLAFALSFAMPAYAEDAAYESAYALEDEAVEASQEGTTELETAHNTGCMPNLTVDNPTNGSTVTGAGLVWGWGFDAAHTGLGSGMDVFDLYRGDTFIATAAAGASRDPGNVRSDVDSALGKTDMRAGYLFRVDWSTQPGGDQRYRVLGRTGCEWTERTFNVNVNPAPPAPSASLSINDVSRTIGSTSSSTGIGGSNVVCISYFPSGGCSQYSSQGVGVGGSQCIAYIPGTSTCSQYSSTGVGGGSYCIAYIPGTSTCSQYSSSGIYGGTGVYGTSSEANFDFTVTLSPASTQQVQVDYATADGSAVQGTDYQQMSGTLTFAAGETSKTITVRVYNRGAYGGTRDFTVRLTNARNAGISDGDGRGTIRGSSTSSGCASYDANGNCLSYGSGYGTGIGNCPFGYIWNGISCVVSGTGTGSGLYVNDATCTEGAICSFTVTSPSFTTMTYFTSAGTATAGSACTGSGGPDFVTIAAITISFTSTTTISVTTCSDTTTPTEAAETFTVTATASNVVTSRGTATGTIAAN